MMTWSLLAACQMHACFYGYKAREEKPWGRKRNPGVRRDLWKITPGRLGPAALILGLDCESEFLLFVPPLVKKQEMFQTPQSLI